jgi:glutamate carboxypeptidase
VDAWIRDHGEQIARQAERQLEALVAVSSPSGDVHGAEECASVCCALLPDDAVVERVPCSSPDHAQDVIARLQGTGRSRVVLVGHLDTVVAHAAHRPLERNGSKLIGSGAIDMKGGVVLALGVLRALAERRSDFAEAALLLVCDEEWRTAPFSHSGRFAGWDACLCFEAGELTPDGDEGVIVRRKGAATLHVSATGRASHSGSAPDRGRNALLALAAVASAVATRHDPFGEHRLTAVPTVMNAGSAFNVVPGAGELFCDLRADDESAFASVIDAIPAEHNGVTLAAQMLRVWPGMDAREPTAPVLERASAVLGRNVTGTSRGGASDASHFASGVPVTIDGLGPRGGAAHNPEEFVESSSLATRAEVALAVTAAVLG